MENMYKSSKDIQSNMEFQLHAMYEEMVSKKGMQPKLDSLE